MIKTFEVRLPMDKPRALDEDGYLFVSTLPYQCTTTKGQSMVHVFIDTASIPAVDEHLHISLKGINFTLFKSSTDMQHKRGVGPSIEPLGVDMVPFVSCIFLLHVLD